MVRCVNMLYPPLLSLIQIWITPSVESTPGFFPSASPVMSRLISLFTCQLISITITTLIIHHSFSLSLQAQNLPFQQILPTLDFFYLPDCIHDNMLIVLFLVSHFNFLFVPCGGLSWLPVSFLLHVKYTLSYRIVSYKAVHLSCTVIGQWQYTYQKYGHSRL